MSLADLERKSQVAHATLFDIYSEKTDFKKVSVEVASKIAKALDMSIDELYMKLTYKDMTDMVTSKEFDLYRSDTLHKLRRDRWKKFVEKHKSEVNELYKNEEFDKSIYLATLIDDICKKHKEPLIEEFEEVREVKLDKLLVPSSIYFALNLNTITSSELIKKSSKVFLKNNIIEEEIDE